MSTVRERVEKGAALLDVEVPGWFKTIDLESLDLSSCEDCICGQLASQIYYGEVKTKARFASRLRKPKDFWSMIRFLGKRTGLKEPGLGPVSEEFGFDRTNRQQNYRSLDREWGRVIRARLKTEAGS